MNDGVALISCFSLVVSLFNGVTVVFLFFVSFDILSRMFIEGDWARVF